MEVFKPVLWIFNLLVAGGLIFFLFRKSGSHPLKPFYFPALSIKLLSGVAVGVLYFYHYREGDTIGYHYDAVALSNLAWEDLAAYLKILFTGDAANAPVNLRYNLQPRAFWLVRILSLTYLVAGQSYWIASVLFSFFSFAGFWLLGGFLVKHFSIRKGTVLIAFFFFPSVVFWSSGVLKESLAMGALTCIVYVGLSMTLKKKIDWAYTALALILLFVLCLVSAVRLRHGLRDPHYLFTIAILIYVLVLGVLIALATPNFGALSRYRVGFMPFLLLLIAGPVEEWLLKIKFFRSGLSLNKTQ